MYEKPKTISILGVTGSIGDSAVSVIGQHPDKFDVYAVTGHTQVEKLAQQAVKLNAKIAVISDEDRRQALETALSGTKIKALAGKKAILEVMTHSVDIVLSAIVGFAALEPTMAAIQAGNKIALANKECLVCAGDLMLQAVAKHESALIPVDSEHNAIFQVLENHNHAQIRRLILTASGGPFRQISRTDLAKVTKAQALKHPNWSMGAKITIDSATMMNKALELIEAHFLFGLPPTQIEAVIHPQSIIHSMVEYRDGSVLAQMGPHDMRVAIALALAWPNRVQLDFEPFDFLALPQGLQFEKACEQRFPALRLARNAMQAGQYAMIALNAANEIAVQAFLDDRISFADIEKIVETTMEKAQSEPISDIDHVIEQDKKYRHMAFDMINNSQDFLRRDTA